MGKQLGSMGRRQGKHRGKHPGRRIELLAQGQQEPKRKERREQSAKEIILNSNIG